VRTIRTARERVAWTAVVSIILFTTWIPSVRAIITLIKVPAIVGILHKIMAFPAITVITVAAMLVELAQALQPQVVAEHVAREIREGGDL
jgi:hypothetical protein